MNYTKTIKLDIGPEASGSPVTSTAGSLHPARHKLSGL